MAGFDCKMRLVEWQKQENVMYIERTQQSNACKGLVRLRHAQQARRNSPQRTSRTGT